MMMMQKPISKMLKAQKSKPPLCHTLPGKYTSVLDVALKLESIFDELKVTTFHKLQLVNILYLFLNQ